MKIIALVLLGISGEITNDRLQYPGRNEKLKLVLQTEWETYYKCLLNNSGNAGKIQLQHVLPGQTARLVCSPCRKPFNQVSEHTWKQRTLDLNSSVTDYENLSEAFTMVELNDLVIKNARPEYSGIYQCFRGEGCLSTHIIEIHQHVALVLVDRFEQPYDRINNSIQLEIEWEEWSKCSKCGTVGKRFKYGKCLLTNENHLFHQMSCFSKFLDNATRNQVKAKSATNFVLIEMCKVDCETAENTANHKKDDLWELLQTALDREIINSRANAFLNLQCPGSRAIRGNIPVTWKVLNMEIIPEALAEQTKGRVVIDLLNRLQFREVKLQDSNVYSCWQQDKMVGIIHLDVEENEHKSGNFLQIFTAMSIIFLAIYITLKSLAHKGQ